MTAASPREVVTAGCLAGVSVAAWLSLFAVGETAMEVEAAPFLAGWAAMMAAMMLPSASALVLLYARQGKAAPLAGAYLLVWTALGVPVFALHRSVGLMEIPVEAVGAVLVAAGVYQLTPLKAACLRRCRSPIDFLAVRWRRGPFRLGLEHAVYCLGCCIGLMAVLVGAAAMSLAAAAAVALLVFAEKVLPGGERVALLAGGALVATGIVVVV